MSTDETRVSVGAFGRELLHRTRQQSFSIAGGGYFTPPSVLKRILTEDVIRRILYSNPKIREDQISFFVSLIRKDALIVFSILLHDANEAFIPDFLYHRAHDSGLPFSNRPFLESLPASLSTAFLDRQWEYLPVDLHRGDIHRDLSPKAVLPFLEDSYIDSGAFGDVFKVNIHEECQNLFPEADRAIIVARKQLRVRSSLDDESTTLELLRKLRHSNIVELLSTYTYRNSYNMLFPLADMNLYQFFRTDLVLPSTTIFSEIFGLADALAQLHNFTLTEDGLKLSRIGYHHDLRPANILVKGSKFLISDFGLSNLKPEDETSKSRLRGGQDDYLPPESFNETAWTNGYVGRTLDIWAFGCILAEFATYMNGSSVEDFRKSRQATHGTDFLSVTDNAFHLHGALRPAVGNWLDHVVASTVRSGIAELVCLSREMLNPVWRRRISISHVVRRIADIVLMSTISAIIDSFAKFEDYLKEFYGRKDICLFLEGKRFSAWNHAFNSLDAEKLRMSFTETSAVLNKILVDVEAYSSRYNISDPAKTDIYEEYNLVNGICASLDRLQRDLSKFGQAEMNKFWIRSVAEINDTQTLLKIRSISSDERYQAVGIKAAMKYMSRAVSQAISTGGVSMLVDQGIFEADDEDEQDDNPDDALEKADRIAGDWDGYRVIVEWTNYDQQWMGAKGSAMWIRMEEIAKFLHGSQSPQPGDLSNRILDCLGYFHDFKKWRFGFIYAMPRTADEIRNYYSLTTIIKSNTMEMTEKCRPALGDIFKLAYGLSSCLHTLHEIGWLHKGVTSENILLFAPSMEDALLRLSTGILAGFSQSRKEGSAATLGPNNSFRLYQHPQYKNANSTFKRIYDYYSLGIVLLELGLWVTIFDIWKDSDLGRRETVAPEEMREVLSKQYIPKLRGIMGTAYQNAVSFCINPEKLLDSPIDEKESQRAAHTLFNKEVVEQLAKCFA